MGVPSKCVGCKHAEWKRTKSGALHPDGSGRCTWTIKLNYAIPASMYYLNDPRKSSLYGGRIARVGTDGRRIEECPTFEPCC